VIGAAVLAFAFSLGRRSKNDATSFTAATVSALLLSPLVWLHYFVLLLVLLAILRPRFGPLWIAPLVLWICPDGLAGPSWYPAALLIACSVVIADAALAYAPHAANLANGHEASAIGAPSAS
jgi:hypothetical protein